MAVNQCQYIKTCPVYQGKDETKSSSLIIYRNVFCNRGLKGWNNCKQFIDYKEQELVKNSEND